MAGEILLCTDGSDLSTEALRAGIAVVRADAERVVVTVNPGVDPTLVTGTGFAGGVMSGEEINAHEQAMDERAQTIIDEVTAALGLPPSAGLVVRGEPGSAICELAAERQAGAVVIGTRGRGGLKRALLGSTSDHIVRHAPCPVVVYGEPDGGA
jgi:nucleotide-binding universal stress UspA family protein